LATLLMIYYCLYSVSKVTLHFPSCILSGLTPERSLNKRFWKLVQNWIWLERQMGLATS
jgi:hypothetical protein